MNDDQLLRYSRHILLPQVDIDGQEQLQASKVMIIGLGGLGCPVAMYLVSAGVGEIVLCDFDQVEQSNLQRQVLYDEQSIGLSKVDAAIKRLSLMNSECSLSGIKEIIEVEMLSNIFEDKTSTEINLVIDCTDNLLTRLMINQACVNSKIQLVSGAAIRMEGQIATFFNSGDGPCYQCLFSNVDEKQLNCSEAGVLATTVGIIGTLQAQQVLKMLMNIGQVVDGGLTLMDGMSGDWQSLKVNKRADCPICNSVSN